MPKSAKSSASNEQEGPPNALIFAASIAKMGDKRLIVIPKSLHEMLRSFEDKDLIVTLKKTTDRVSTPAKA